jgi:hypothetical protein
MKPTHTAAIRRVTTHTTPKAEGRRAQLDANSCSAIRQRMIASGAIVPAADRDDEKPKVLPLDPAAQREAERLVAKGGQGWIPLDQREAA